MSFFKELGRNLANKVVSGEIFEDLSEAHENKKEEIVRRFRREVRTKSDEELIHYINCSSSEEGIEICREELERREIYY